MTKCDYCGTTILFGGAREGNRRFCNARCRQRGGLLALSEQLPQEAVQQRVREVRQGNCPRCKGNGPVDVHTSYRIWSAVYLTSWSSRPQVSCRSCGIKRALGDTAFSFILGWWGFPWGLIITPVQVVRNLRAVVGGPDPSRPSAQLEKFVRMSMAAAPQPINIPASPQPVYQLYLHRPTGERYAFKIEGGRVTGCLGPQDLPPWGATDLTQLAFDERPDQVAWANDHREEFDLTG